MTAPVTLTKGVWTQVAAAGFMKALIGAPARSGVWFELSATQPSANAAQLGIHIRGGGNRTIETGDTSLALWAHPDVDDGASKVQVLVSGSPEVINKDEATTGHVLQCAEVTFTETSGAGTYTGEVVVPAGATLHDIVINGVALWDNAGAVSMDVGDDTDPNGYFAGVDLKATDLLAGESLSFALAGGKAGAYIANSQVSPRYAAAQRTITGTVVTASTGGTAGRTRMTVVWSKPTAVYIEAATKA